MWQIVHGTYFERVGRGVIPHGPGSLMDWTQSQAESYGLERLRKVAEPEPVAMQSVVVAVDPLDVLRDEATRLGVQVNRRWREARLKEEIANAKSNAANGE